LQSEFVSLLEEDRAKDEALLESIGDGVIATDRSGTIIRINQAAENMLGAGHNELMNQNLVGAIKMEDLDGNVIAKADRPNVAT